MNLSSTSPTNHQLNLTNLKQGPIIFALILGAFVSLLNETLLGNALPVLMTELNVTASTIQWLTTAYMLVVGILVPITALLQQWFTTRQMFLSAMLTFLIGTIIAALSPSFFFLLIGRIIQAFGTGLMLPLLMNTILIIYPSEKRGAAMGLVGLVMLFAPAIGPTLSGVIIDSLEWRWLFYMVIPLTVISILIAFKYLQNVTELKRPKVDYLSIILSTLGFGGIVYSFSASGDLGWSDLKVLLAIIIGVLSLLFFTIRQLKIENPILDLRAFSFPMFTLPVVIMFIVMMTMFSTMALLPMFLQTVLLVTAFKSGLIMLPGSIISGIMGPIAGSLFDKYRAKSIIIPGIILVALGVFLFTTLDKDTSVLQLIVMHSLLMLGIIFVMTSQTFGLNQLTPNLYPHGTAIFNTLSQVAGAIGTALGISKMSSGTSAYMEESNHPSNPIEKINGLTSGFHDSFMMALYLIVIALVVSLFIKDQKKKN
ncbi:MDR family MFS transporter [Lysinibacillus cavernae]|uniref:MDR family MFS transporter n=1 Tax=Lysinibacillus cavernae TaxID=2666135 RepID=UPI0012D910C0|nr:MDR family MFS transporter [Lysinibacillus cavernae]